MKTFQFFRREKCKRFLWKVSSWTKESTRRRKSISVQGPRKQEDIVPREIQQNCILPMLISSYPHNVNVPQLPRPLCPHSVHMYVGRKQWLVNWTNLKNRKRNVKCVTAWKSFWELVALHDMSKQSWFSCMYSLWIIMQSPWRRMQFCLFFE